MMRWVMTATGAAMAACLTVGAMAADPGVSATEIKIGNTMPYSGPVSSYSPIGKLETAFFNMVNDQGGVAGHKINFISLDDGYSPPKTVEQVRRLVEEDQVAFLFNTLGTPTNSAIVRYVNQKKVPHLFVATGAAKWADEKQYPWTTGFQPDYRTEAQIYAKYILQQRPDSKVAVLYQNDDFGKDYLIGLRAGFGDRYAKMVTEAPTNRQIRQSTARSPRCRAQGLMCWSWRPRRSSRRRQSARCTISAGSRCSPCPTCRSPWGRC
jgi:branched-chain amino acid transport system substrate-binding protein